MRQGWFFLVSVPTQIVFLCSSAVLPNTRSAVLECPRPNKKHGGHYLRQWGHGPIFASGHGESKAWGGWAIWSRRVAWRVEGLGGAHRIEAVPHWPLWFPFCESNTEVKRFSPSCAWDGNSTKRRWMWLVVVFLSGKETSFFWGWTLEQVSGFHARVPFTTKRGLFWVGTPRSGLGVLLVPLQNHR